MQIDFLVYDIHMGAGGERVVVNMANYLVNNGYNVVITSLSTVKESSIFDLDHRIKIRYLNIRFEKGLNLFNKILSALKVKKFYKNIQNEIILGIGTYPSLLLTFLNKRHHVKTIGCHHLSYSAVVGSWKVLSRIFFPRLDCLISLTERDVTRMCKLNKNIRVIPNSVSFYPKNAASLTNKKILAVGRFDFVKGYDLLVRVFEKFAVLDKEWNLQIIGDGPQRESITLKIDKAHLSDRIKILPYTSSILEEYMDSSIFIMTSRAEGLPMVLLEAQACGLPIVCFNCETGPAEIVNDTRDGYLIDNFDVEEMVSKLFDLSSHDEKRKGFGNNARENCRKFLPENIFEKWENLFREMEIDEVKIMSA